MSKVPSYLQLSQDKAVFDLDNSHQFQFCKRCKTGEHIVALVKHLAPELDLSGLKLSSLVYLEHHYYNRLSKKIPYRFLRQEMERLVVEVKKRLKHLQA